jgi:hypothetical protein
VASSPDEGFYSRIEGQFDSDNMVDYFIFFNLVHAKDNAGKNIFIAKYDAGTPYFYVPWDLDLTFGYSWTSGNIFQYQRENGNSIIINGLYKRQLLNFAPDGFVAKLRQRWHDLRMSKIISTEHLISLFQLNYDYLHSNGVYKREAIAWPEYFNSNLDAELLYVSNWIGHHVSYLDKEFEYVPDANKSGEIEKEMLKIYPNPASEFIFIHTPYAGNWDVSIYDTQGQLVKQTLVSPSEKTISLSGVTSGVYFIHFSNKTMNEVRKIIIKHNH